MESEESAVGAECSGYGEFIGYGECIDCERLDCRAGNSEESGIIAEIWLIRKSYDATWRVGQS